LIKKKWKSVFRIDTPSKDLKQFFKKFNPDSTTGRAPLNTQILKDLELSLSDEEIDQVLKLLDPKGRGFIFFDDLVSQWIFLKKEKAMVDKKKAVQKSISSTPSK